MGRYHIDRPDRPMPLSTWVYFARGRQSGLIKIGFSANPEYRKRGLRHDAGEPVDILFTEPGNRVQEAGYHRRFADSWDHGEWFHESDRLHAFLVDKGHGGIEKVIKSRVVHLPSPTRVVKLLKPVFIDKRRLNVPTQPMTIGYARVSTEDQNLDVQLTALRSAGVQDKYLFVEKLSAMNTKRPQFNLALMMLERGDTLIVHSLSRLGRDVKQIHAIIDSLTKEGILWRSLTEPHLNNATAVGRLMLNVTGAMAQFERDQIIERTKFGMNELRRRGVPMGRPELISDKDAKKMARMRARGVSVVALAKQYGIKPSTVYARTNVILRKQSKT